jgi:hypothetical protein
VRAIRCDADQIFVKLVLATQMLELRRGNLSLRSLPQPIEPNQAIGKGGVDGKIRDLFTFPFTSKPHAAYWMESKKPFARKAFS